MTGELGSAIRKWLPPSESTAVDGYQHVLLSEEPTEREAGIEALKAYVEHAHADARSNFEELFSTPLRDRPVVDLDAFPDNLHTTTLQGYLGEIMAAVIAEHYEPHGREWTVPGFLFRFHTQAHEAMERLRQSGAVAKKTPGRTGDDCLAFSLDDDGRVDAWLFCESKCSLKHSSSLISEGLGQASIAYKVPVSLAHLRAVVREAATHDVAMEPWRDALDLLQVEDGGAEQYALFVYVCGRRPVQKDTWMPTNERSKHYPEGAAAVVAAEVHIDEVGNAIVACYPGHTLS